MGLVDSFARVRCSCEKESEQKAAWRSVATYFDKPRSVHTSGNKS
jgi:hypothetical protein